MRESQDSSNKPEWLGYPPLPSPILPSREEFDSKEWIIQPKRRGWRIVICNGQAYTKQGEAINLPKAFLSFRNVQLDGEIISWKRPETEHQMEDTIRNSRYSIALFDIYSTSLEDAPLYLDDERTLSYNTTVMSRYAQLREIYRNCYDIVYSYKVQSYSDIFRKTERFVQEGCEGAILKKKCGVYKVSEHSQIIDPDWIKIEP